MTSEALRPAGVGHVLAGRYRLVDRVRPVDTTGASLWQATDEILGRRVAVHLHEPGGMAARHLLAAAKLAGRVNHPVLANVFDAGDSMTCAYVVSEWVDGTPLSHLVLRGGPLDDDRAADVLAEVASAVDAAHRAGVVHGRITADRVIMTASGARVTGIGFAPPSATREEDIRALGGLLYAMITGYWPLTGQTALPRVDLRAGRIPAPRQVEPRAPADLEQLALRILQPEGRPGGPISTAAALNAVLDTRPWTTPSEPPPRGFWTRRIGLAAFLVTAAVVGWAIGTVIGTVPETDPVVPRAPSGSGSGSSPVPTPAASAPPAQTPAPAPSVVVPISAASAFDPNGDKRENDSLVPLAYDGDPATAWLTERYHNRADFAGLKPGVGLMVDLGRPADIRTVRLAVPTPGISLQLRAGDVAGTTLEEFALVAQATAADKAIELTPPASVLARYWVVWVTGLVPDGTSATTYRAGIAEMSFVE